MSKHPDNASLLPYLKMVLLYASGPFLGLALFFFANEGFAITANSTAPLVVALIGYVVAQHVVNAFDDVTKHQFIKSQINQIDEQITRTSNAFRADLSASFKVAHVRDTEANERIAASLRTAYHVKNTYVVSKDITGIRTTRGLGMVEHYQIILSKDKNTTWQDLVGVGELLDGRFEEINRDCRADIKGTHEIFLISTHVPVLNFLLCGPRQSEFTEVYFGWVKNMTNDVDVFHSRDERLILMFNNYFDTLKRTKDRVVKISVSYDDKPAERFLKSIPNRLCGTWVTVSESVKTISAHGVMPNPAKGELAAYAIITISYDEEWRVEGRTCGYPSHKVLYLFSTDMCVLYENTIHYKYRTRSTFKHSKSEGIGQYSIAQDHDILSGIYVKRGSNKSANLKAKKVSPEIVNDPDLVEKILAEIVTN